MPRTRTPLSRRTVIRGAGIALALPPLEAMAPAGRARAAVPSRFVIAFGGTSTGGLGKPDEIVAPAAVGPGYAATGTLAPLAELGVTADVGIVSGLAIPWATGGAVPPGGRVAGFHGTTMVPQVTGLRALAHDRNPTGGSADQIVAEAIGATTPPRSVFLRVQPKSYKPTASVRGRMSWDRKGRPIDPIISPRSVFDALFGTVQTSTDPAAVRAAEAALRARRSVLDHVIDSATRVRGRLGAADRLRLDKHLEDLRAFERSLAPGAEAKSCAPPPAPAADPEVGAAYSDEEQRAQLLVDLLATAMACGVVRVAALQLTFVQSFLGMAALNGSKTDMHDLNHQGSLATLGDCVKWHVKHFARLAERLKRARELDGGAVLDHSALVLVFEGGHGWDPEAGRPHNSHSSENMVALYAGRAGGLRPGQHIRARDKHPAQVVLGAMHAAGARVAALGEVSGLIPEMGAGG
jgi:hypothetical protein